MSPGAVVLRIALEVHIIGHVSHAFGGSIQVLLRSQAPALVRSGRLAKSGFVARAPTETGQQQGSSVPVLLSTVAFCRPDLVADPPHERDAIG